jgi:hypothetical protein
MDTAQRGMGVDRRLARIDPQASPPQSFPGALVAAAPASIISNRGPT